MQENYDECRNNLKSASEEITELKKLISEKDSNIAELKNKIEEQNIIISDKDNEIKNLNSEIETLKAPKGLFGRK